MRPAAVLGRRAVGATLPDAVAVPRAPQPLALVGAPVDVGLRAVAVVEAGRPGPFVVGPVHRRLPHPVATLVALGEFAPEHIKIDTVSRLC